MDYFEEFGFLPLENVFDPVKVLDPIIQEYHGVLDDLVDDLYEEGKISSKFENLTDPSYYMTIPLLFLSALTLIIGIYPALITERLIPILITIGGIF